MTVKLSPIWGAGSQLFSDNGVILSGGKIYTYAAGTTTPKTTYTSVDGITAHANPIILDAAGRVPSEIWLTDGEAYKFILKDSNNNLIGSWDDLIGLNPTVEAGNIVYNEGSAGAVDTTVEAKLQEIVMRTDFSTETDYLTVAKTLPTGGFWMDQSPQPRHWRFADRAFIGAAAGQSTGNKFQGTPPTGTFLTTQMGAFWMERGATTLSVSPYGEFGGVFAARTSDKALSGYYGTATIGLLGIADNDDTTVTQTIAWAGYFECNRSAANKTSYGLEISLKNKGNNIVSTPYARNGWGTVGIWLPAGGDASYNGVNANPCATALMIGRGDDQGNSALPMTWNRGIIFNADGITGTDGVTGTGIAIELAVRHVIRWANSAGQTAANLYATATDTTKAQGLIFADSQIEFTSGGAGYTFILGASTGTANQIRVYSTATTEPPIIQAGGTDTDIDIRLVPKGSGYVRFGGFGASADVPVTGYVTIKDDTGTLRKLAVVA